MKFRLVWALITAIVGGIQLRRALRIDGTDSSSSAISEATTARTGAADAPSRSAGLVSALRVAALTLCALWSVCWVVLALIRLRCPFELEWIGGAMRDHCERLLAGLPLYVPPGPEWFPYEYPPLYFWVSACVTRLTGCDPYLGMRLISILCTLGCAALVLIWIRRLIGARKIGLLWGALSAGLFLAAYRMTGAWYDVERLDMQFLFLSLLGIVWLGEGLAVSILSALALALAFFTKQQAVLFIIAGAAALAWRRDWRQLIGFCVTALLACLLPTLALNAATHGWFGYYCFKVPLANGIQMNLARLFVVSDLPLYAPMIVIVGMASAHKGVGRWALGVGERQGIGDEVLVAMTVAGLFGSLLSRAHWGGDQNVLIAGYLFLGIAACAAAGRWEVRQPAARAPLYALLLAQLFALTYRPDAQLPIRGGLEAGRRYEAAIRALEREGEVLCLDHGGLTAPPHFQIMGLLDVLKTEKQVPPALTVALRTHRFVAVVTDELPKPDTLFYGELLRDYAPAERLNIETSWVVTGYPTPSPTRPTWVLRPRR